jgi:pilus assembly protein Flp/PilA
VWKGSSNAGSADFAKVSTLISIKHHAHFAAARLRNFIICWIITKTGYRNISGPIRNKYGARTAMKAIVVDFLKDEAGATAIEYGLIATGIAIAIITAVNGLGTKLSTNFNTISTSLK